MRYPEGLFGWVDLSTSDTQRAKEFYTALFGWTAHDQPLGGGMEYTQFTIDGGLVAGMGPIPPGMQMPSVWNSYVMVADAADAAARAEAAGGSVVMPPMQVMDQGSMAMLMDPSGAVVGVWQPAAHEGADVFNAPGALTWNELQSRDLAAAKPFYAQVFGWEWQPGPSPGYDLAILNSKEGEDKTNAGAMGMPPGVPDEVPSYWMVYFAVEDCDDTMARAVGLGASVMFDAMEMGPGRFGGLIDPTGAGFAVGSFPG